MATETWIDWNGGECPVPNDVPVEVRNGEGLYRSEVPQALPWGLVAGKTPSAISAYRTLSADEAAEMRAHAISHNRKMGELRDRALAARAVAE